MQYNIVQDRVWGYRALLNTMFFTSCLCDYPETQIPSSEARIDDGPNIQDE